VGLAAFSALLDKAPSAPFPLLEDTMTTARTRSLVSLAAALTVTATLGGCASAPSSRAEVASALTNETPATVRFVNDARDYVHVYLIGAQREWVLGRVEPGARATLRIPEAALDSNAGPMRLAVLTGQRVTLRAAAEPRAEITMPQPADAILSQRWTYSQTPAKRQLTGLRIWTTGIEAGR
jgi:hypothetical protein